MFGRREKEGSFAGGAIPAQEGKRRQEGGGRTRLEEGRGRRKEEEPGFFLSRMLYQLRSIKSFGANDKKISPPILIYVGRKAIEYAFWGVEGVGPPSV